MPDPAARATYEQMMPVFEKLYAALEPVYADIAAL